MTTTTTATAALFDSLSDIIIGHKNTISVIVLTKITFYKKKRILTKLGKNKESGVMSGDK